MNKRFEALGLKVLEGGQKAAELERFLARWGLKADASIRRSPEVVVKTFEVLKSRGEPADDVTAFMALFSAAMLLFDMMGVPDQTQAEEWPEVLNALRRYLREEFSCRLHEMATVMLKEEEDAKPGAAAEGPGPGPDRG